MHVLQHSIILADTGEKNFSFSFTDPLLYFSQLIKKNENEEKMIFKFRKFCNRASCLHNTLPQRTAASNTESKIKRREAMCDDINLNKNK